MNDPNLVKIALEQMSRLSPDDFARIQQQMMSNPELLQIATRSLENLRPEDIKLTAEQLKNVWPDQMAEIGEKMANVSLEELTSMSAMFGSQISYENAAAEMLKKQGNELHSQGKYSSALKKYIQAKQNLKDVSSSSGQNLLSACSLNMMSCYLKTRQFEECINEGREVLAYDATNLKALYRRGQAYKELEKLTEAVCDLTKALEISPADETIAEALRDAEERLMGEGCAGQSKGLIIEEIVDEATAFSEKNSMESESEVTSQENSNETVNLTDSEEELLRILEDIKSRSDPETWSALVEVLENGCSDPRAAVHTLYEMMSPEEHSRICVSYGVEYDAPYPVALKSAGALFGQMSEEERKIFYAICDGEDEGLLQFLSGPIEKNYHEELRALFEGVTDEPNQFMSDAMAFMSSMPNGMLKAWSELEQDGKDMIDSVFSSKHPLVDLVKLGDKLTSRLSTESRQMFINECRQMRADLSAKLSKGFDVGAASSSSPGFLANFRKLMRHIPEIKQRLRVLIGNANSEMMLKVYEQIGCKLSPEDQDWFHQVMSCITPHDLDFDFDTLLERVQEREKMLRNRFLTENSGMILSIDVNPVSKPEFTTRPVRYFFGLG